MRRCLGVLMVFTLLLAFGTTVRGADTWVSGATGNWTDGTKWGNAVPPTTAETAQIYNGTATLDSTQTIGQLLMANGLATDVGVLNINSGTNLTVAKSTTEVFGIGKVTGATATVNHNGGTVTVYSTTATTGELRIGNVAGTTSNYNLNGGVLDVQILNRGDKTRTGANFTATGGILAVRTSIIKWGLVSAGYTGFHQGGAELAPGALNLVGTMTTGNSTNEMDYFMDDSSKIVFDLGDGNPDAALSVNDKITAWGNFQINGQLLVNFTDLANPPELGDKWNVWTIESTKLASYSGSGAFDLLPNNIKVNWIDTGNGKDTLQLELVPEPATIALLGLGLIALRRNKK